MQDINNEDLVDLLKELLLTAQLLKSYIDVQPEQNVMHLGTNMPLRHTTTYADLSATLQKTEKSLSLYESSRLID